MEQSSTTNSYLPPPTKSNYSATTTLNKLLKRSTSITMDLLHQKKYKRHLGSMLRRSTNSGRKWSWTSIPRMKGRLAWKSSRARWGVWLCQGYKWYRKRWRLIYIKGSRVCEKESRRFRTRRSLRIGLKRITGRLSWMNWSSCRCNMIGHRKNQQKEPKKLAFQTS